MIKIDIIIPVYKGLKETQKCLNSVLLYTDLSKYRLIIIDDCSPERELTEFLEQLQDRQRNIVLINHEQNMGFVRSVNQGMQYDFESDVLLLNSDTEVSVHWVEKLVAAAYSDPDIGTVTPLSNNATICSYPCMNKNNKLPRGQSLESLNLLLEGLFRQETQELPTGVGFCLYIKRQALHDAGYFDAEAFGLGYGEEVDFCLRMKEKGWKSAVALNTYVYHYGSISFLDKRAKMMAAAEKIINERYPEYEGMRQNFVLRDPLCEIRLKIALAVYSTASRPAFLFITHNMGGGTKKCVVEMASSWIDKGYQVFILQPFGGRVLLSHAEETEFSFVFDLLKDYDLLLDLCRCLRIGLIHYHNILGYAETVRNLPSDLGCPYCITVHDYYFICPRVSLSRNGRYCEEKGVEYCSECLSRNPKSFTTDIVGWRERNFLFLQGADKISVPSFDTMKRMKRYFPSLSYYCVPHPETAVSNFFIPFYYDSSFRIGVVGAVSQIKGADLLYSCVRDAKRRRLPLDYMVIGYTYRQKKSSGMLRITGEYREDDLKQLISREKPDILFFPGQVPETFSYTLSSAILAGLPMLVTDIGAVEERVRNDNLGWIISRNASAHEVNDKLMSILNDKQDYEAKRKNVKLVKLEREFILDNYYILPINIPKKQVRGSLDIVKLWSLHRKKWQTRWCGRILAVCVAYKHLPVLRQVYQLLGLSWKEKIKGWFYKKS